MTSKKENVNSKQMTSKPRQAYQEIIMFCILAYGLSWGWWGIRFAPFWKQLIAFGTPISRLQIGTLDIQLGMFGPLIAAIIMRSWISKESFHFSLRLSRDWKAYLFAVLVPTGLVTTTILVNSITGLGHFSWAGDSVLQVILNFVLIIPLATVSAIGEEYGWRGYLLPRLLHSNEIRTSIVIGLIWALWHLPLLIAGLTFPGQPASLAMPVFIIAIVMDSFLFTWLYQVSGGSFWIAALLHGTLNALTELTSVKHYPDSNQLIVGVFGVTCTVILLIGVLVYYLTWKHDSLTRSRISAT